MTHSEFFRADGHQTARSLIAGQVVYNIHRAQYNATLGGPAQFLWTLADGTYTQQYASRYNATNVSTSNDYECMNMYVGFCGDGIVDNGASDYSLSVVSTPLNG